MVCDFIFASRIFAGIQCLYDYSLDRNQGEGRRVEGKGEKKGKERRGRKRKEGERGEMVHDSLWPPLMQLAPTEWPRTKTGVLIHGVLALLYDKPPVSPTTAFQSYFVVTKEDHKQSSYFLFLGPSHGHTSVDFR